LQALTLAGYQPTGNIRSRVRMVASLFWGRSSGFQEVFGGTGFLAGAGILAQPGKAVPPEPLAKWRRIFKKSGGPPNS